MGSPVIRDLLNRRVPQILGLYLGTSWIIIEFIDLLVDRFLLSTNLIALSMVVLGSLIPTVFLLAYFHGMPGRNEWATAEKIGIPMNLLVASVLIVMLFADRPLGAETTTVLMRNEEGVTVERVIPRGEFRKKVVLFNFDNESGDRDLDWLQSGLSLGLVFDLYQDLYIDFASDKWLQEELNKAGYPEGVGLPLTLQASLAETLHGDYFVRGSFKKVEDGLEVHVDLYETRRQKLLADQTYRGGDALGLIDQMSLRLRYDLGIPDRYIQETRDLRIADIITHSRECFRSLVYALRAIYLENDWEEARRLLEGAVEQDPTSAFAQLFLSSAYLLLNRKEEADSAAHRSMRFIYRLPERMQFSLKHYYYEAIEIDADKRFAVAKMNVEFFPDDIEAHALLAREYEHRNDYDAVIAEYQRILDLDPSQYDYLRWIGYVYKNRGEFDKALEYFRRYAQAVPTDHTGFESLGNLYEEMGDFELAKSYYERALVIDSDNVDLMNNLATVAFNLGDFDGSREQHERALAAARTPAERASAYWRLSYHHETRGQLAKAIEYKELEWAERAREMPPAIVMVSSKLWALGLFAEAGQEERALDVLRQAEAELALPFSRQVPVGYLQFYLAVEDTERANAALQQLETLVDETEAEVSRHRLLEARGRILELEGEYERAIESYQRSLELAPTGMTRYRAIGRCYRELGNLAEAKANLERNLQRTPFNPKTHYELSLVYADLGDHQQALEHLSISLDVWVDADPEFKPAREAREKLAELETAEMATF